MSHDAEDEYPRRPVRLTWSIARYIRLCEPFDEAFMDTLQDALPDAAMTGILTYDMSHQLNFLRLVLSNALDFEGLCTPDTLSVFATRPLPSANHPVQYGLRVVCRLEDGYLEQLRSGQIVGDRPALSLRFLPWEALLTAFNLYSRCQSSEPGCDPSSCMLALFLPRSSPKFFHPSPVFFSSRPAHSDNPRYPQYLRGRRILEPNSKQVLIFHDLCIAEQSSDAFDCVRTLRCLLSCS
jgi:hypothetical protein